MPFILQVALDTPLHRLFDYRLPEQLGPVQKKERNISTTQKPI